ncbi:MAG: nicotinic acid mononucleotide adenyltransferase [Sediminicola sp.]|tara:strand:- start:198 stop:551 length:354 start_codon:yes stop_codon:yes gene_type:complete
MKKIVFIFAVICSVGLYAQAPEPVFEKDGDLVKATYFHENGEVEQTGHFLNGKLEGKWTMFNEKGDKIAMGSYEQGQKAGKWFFWKADGLQEVDFNNNRIATVTKWNSTGTVVVQNK